MLMYLKLLFFRFLTGHACCRRCIGDSEAQMPLEFTKSSGPETIGKENQAYVYHI